MTRIFRHLVMRDLRLALRQGTDVAMVISFFVITVTLFPLGVGPEPNVLARIAAGVVWVTALLAVMLSLERLFQADYEDGSVDLLLLTPAPLELVVLAKVVAHWLLTGFPLIVTAPVLAALMNMPGEGYPVLVATMALADAEPDRRRRCRADPGRAPGRRADIAAGTAALYSRADLRGGGGRRGDHGFEHAPASVDPGRHARRSPAARPVGGGSGVTA